MHRSNNKQFSILPIDFFFSLLIFEMQQGPMRQSMMVGAQPGMVPAGLGSIQQPAQPTVLSQPIATDHQNGKNNVQLDPFGAF